MRRVVLSVLLFTLFAFMGCQNCVKCQRNGYSGAPFTKHHHSQYGYGKNGKHDPVGENVMPPAGPPVGTYAYPYYTLRGPRDFLQSNPPSIGPY